MFCKNVRLLLLGLAALGGCRAIHEARDAQKGVRDRADESKVLSSPVCTLDFGATSLKDFVRFALDNRPSVTEATLAVQDARLALRQIAADAPILSREAWKSPDVSVSGGYSASSKAAQGLDDLKVNTDGSASGTLSVELLLWDFGRNAAEAEAKTEEVLASEMSLVNAGYEVFDDVTTSYFTLLEDKALLEVAQTNEFLSAEYLRQAEARLEAGEAQKLDVVKAKLQLCEAREKSVSASNDVVIAASKFVQALGLEPGSVTREQVLAVSTNGLASVTRGFPESVDTASEAFAEAKVNAPSMRLMKARLRAASSRVDGAIADLMPSISASASLNWTDPLWLWRWGVSGAQTLFQGFRKTTAVDRAVISMQSAAAAVDRTERDLGCEIDSALAVRDNAREARKSAQASVEQARENLDMVTRQYEVGDVSRVEYTSAITDYATALGNRISAFYRGQRAEAALFRLLGRYPDFQQETIQEENK